MKTMLIGAFEPFGGKGSVLLCRSKARRFVLYVIIIYRSNKELVYGVLFNRSNAG